MKTMRRMVCSQRCARLISPQFAIHLTELRQLPQPLAELLGGRIVSGRRGVADIDIEAAGDALHVGINALAQVAGQRFGETKQLIGQLERFVANRFRGALSWLARLMILTR